MKKRILGLLLALTTALSLAAPAFAAGSGEAASGEPAPAGAVEKSAPAPSQAAGVTASGNCGAQGSNVTWKLTDDGVLTISGIGAMDDWDHNGGPWSGYLPDITSVQILSGVTNIGDCAFIWCRSLASVTIHASVTSIGWEAFSSCDSLTSVTIPTSMTSIGDAAFEYCTSLTSVTIPASVTSIGDGAFGYCDSLTAINVDSGNKNYCSVGGVLFNKEKTELIQYPIGKSGTSYSIPSGVTSIGAYAFECCESLTSVTIPGNVTSIGERAFHNCSPDLVIYGKKGSYAETYAKENGISFQTSGITDSGVCGAEGDNLTWELTDNGVLTISGTGAMADWGSTNPPWYDYRNTITSAKILSGVISIGDDAFYNCDSLTSVTIPSSVTSIGGHAFCICESLTSVTIPAGVTNIGDGVFIDCTSLTAINVASGNKNYCSVDGVLFNKAKTELIQCPAGKSGAYSIPSGVTSIEDCAFMDCTSLTSVTIPASVTSIGDDAFYNCDSLTSVTIPSSVTNIVTGAFQSCSGLTAINVASGNKNYCSVGGVLFNKAKTELIQYPGGKSGAYSIPSGVTSIGDRAFAWCYDLTSVTIPASVTSIGDSAFSACASLKSVTIPGSVTNIGDDAFYYCDSLTSVTIPSSVTSIGEYAFAWCDSLKSVTIPASVTSIGDGAFVRCSPDLVIYGKKGSYAETYAEKNSIKFSDGTAPKYPLSAPKLSKVENVNGGVKVTWGKVTGAEKYRVFYKPSGGSWAKAGDTTSTSYTWKGAKSGTTYQFRVWCVSADGKTQTSTYDTIKTITYVAAPSYTLSTPSTGGIKLSWSKVTGASKYKVFYKTTGDWKTLTTTADTSYTVKSPKAGTKYTFRVRCVDSAGAVVSGYITDKTITYQAPAKPSQLPAPKLTKVENVNGGVKVTWGKVTGAEKYRVFYKPSGGSWAKAGDTTSTSYTWKGAKSGTTYQFRVWCVSADGKTQTSTYDTIKTITYIAAPSYTLSTPTTGGIKLSWSKVTGASKYRIYYKTTGDWKTLTTTTGTSYTVKSPKAGTKYTFRVRCVDSAGAVVSGYITDKTITYQAPAKPSQLPAPKLTKVENVNGGVKVTWGKVTGAEKYRVFYKPSGGSWAKAGDTTSTSYTWKGAKSGTSYQFRVWCVSADGKTQTSTYDTIKTITYVAAPSYTLSTPSTGGIKLSWSKVTGASKYRIYYKTTGDWKTLTTTTSTSYTIKSPKAGTKYTFRVRCVDSAGSVVSGYITDKTLTYMK